MDGVRAAWRWLLAAHPWVHVTAEAATVREALAAPGEAVLSGLRFPDGAVDRLFAAERPVVVWTFLPADERLDVQVDAAVAVIGPGELRAQLDTALRRAALHSDAGTPPRRATRRDV